MTNTITKFNVRVYFLLTNDAGAILVADEIIKGNAYTKFPGGGLEFGEGTLACAMREAREELGQEIINLQHFYTTDFFLPSAFHPSHQVISIYYTAQLKESAKFRYSAQRFDFSQTINDEESFRWVMQSELDENEFSFAADKKVVQLLKS
jgi:8-oxo-dGTP diphosphatase